MAQMPYWDSLGLSLSLLSQLHDNTQILENWSELRTHSLTKSLFLFQHKILYCFVPKS